MRPLFRPTDCAAVGGPTISRVRVRRIGSKVLQDVEASSPAEAAYLFEGTGAPMEIVPPAWPATWRFRRFDEKQHNAFTIAVLNEQLV